MKKFKHEIIEGDLYIISQFEIKANSGNFRPTHHDFRLFFQSNSRVAKIAEDPTIDRYGICPVSFSSIADKHTNMNYIIDKFCGSLSSFCQLSY